MYKVIEMFDDLMDTVPTKEGPLPYRYEKGDMYPRPGAKPSMGRIAELAGSNNLRGRPLITPIQAPPAEPVEAAVEPLEEAVEEVPMEPVKKPRKRRKADAGKDREAPRS